MDILGVGPMELILVLIIALMVFGPDRLPEMGARLGKTLRGMREATREFSKEIDAARQSIEGPVQEITSPLTEIRDSVQRIAPAAEAITHPQEALKRAVMQEFNGTDNGGTTASAGEAPAETARAEANEPAAPNAGAEADPAPESYPAAVADNTEQPDAPASEE